MNSIRKMNPARVLGLVALFALLLIGGCEQNTPLYLQAEGGFAQVTLHFSDLPEGDRADVDYTVTFTIIIHDTGEEIQKELGVLDGEGQGMLEVPADVELMLEAEVDIEGAHFWGEYYDVIEIAPGEVLTGLEIFMFSHP